MKIYLSRRFDVAQQSFGKIDFQASKDHEGSLLI